MIIAAFPCQPQEPAKEATRGPGADSSTLPQLFAFFPKKPLDQIIATCHSISTASSCTKLEIPESTSSGLLICSCTGKDESALQAEALNFSKHFSLQPANVTRLSNGWVIATRDVKLLCSSAEQRTEALAKLQKTRFALSPEDRKSPFRILVRRRDGVLPSQGDLADLKAMGVDVEIETINIFQGETGIKP